MKMMKTGNEASRQLTMGAAFARRSIKGQRGFTLIELIIFIVVVGAGLAGILSVSTTAIKSSADPMIRKQTIAIAESMLEEILLKDYANPTGGYTGTNRALFDDVDDYASYASTGIKDLTGTAVAGLTAYNVAVTIAAPAAVAGVTMKQVTVAVTGGGNTITLTGYRANY